MLQKILFTDSDMDGCGCKIIFELAHRHLKEGVDFTVVNLQHGNIDKEVMDYLHTCWNTGTTNENTVICFSDLCPNRETLIEIQKTNPSIRIWDHHASALFAPEVVPGATVIVENTMGQLQSGTSLIYQHFCSVGFSSNSGVGKFFVNMRGVQSSLVGKLIDNIRSYDTFEFKKIGTIEPKQLNTLFYMLGFDNFYNRYMKRILNPDTDELIDANDMMFVKARLDAEQSLIDKFIKDTRDADNCSQIIPMGIRGLNVAFTFGTRGASISELGYQWLREHPEYDAICSIGLGDKVSFAFRGNSLSNVDVNERLAVPMGGGGHAKAAGAVASQEFVNKLIDLIYHELTKVDPIFEQIQESPR